MIRESVITKDTTQRIGQMDLRPTGPVSDQSNVLVAKGNNAPLNDWGWKQPSYIYAVADSGVALGGQTMIFMAGKTAFRPNGAQHVSLG